jgi:2-oxo-4-hydroxy-4-carboxy-5-ureidoimidazoline decarboxylase
MAGRRPFQDERHLFQAADDTWWALSSPDWLEAFSHHPRIGERAAGWANDEQSGTRSASQKIKDELVKWNGDYERRFGHVFLICATGKQAGDMLKQMERRMNNEPAAELRVAAGEQAKITRLRLEKLLSTETARAG